MPLFDIGTRLNERRKRVDFERQVEKQLPSLMRIARGLVRQQSDAEDLVHDTCVKALGTDPEREFEGEFGFEAWLRRILVNTFRDRYRREKRSPIRPAEYHASPGIAHNVIELAASASRSFSATCRKPSGRGWNGSCFSG